MLEFCILFIILFWYFYNRPLSSGTIQKDTYVVGLDTYPRGSPELRGWDMRSLYEVRPVITDDLTPL